MIETGTTLAIALLFAGAAGGFIKSLVEQKGAVMLPTIETTADGAKYVHLGFIGNVALGAVVAFYTASEPTSAFTAGLTASFIAEKLIERTPAIKAVSPAPPAQ